MHNKNQLKRPHIQITVIWYQLWKTVVLYGHKSSLIVISINSLPTHVTYLSIQFHASVNTVRAVQNFPLQKKRLVYIYRYLWIQPDHNLLTRNKGRLVDNHKKTKQETNQTPPLKTTLVWRVPSQRHCSLKPSFTPHMASPAAGSQCPAGLPRFPEKRWLCGTCNCYCSLQLPELHKPKCRTRNDGQNFNWIIITKSPLLRMMWAKENRSSWEV